MTLLADLRTAGFTVAAVGDKLIVSPASRLTPKQRLTIRAHRDELLAAVLGKAACPLLPRERAPEKRPTVPRTPDRPYLGGPFTPVNHRQNLDRFWQESGWKPVGGWKPGDRSEQPGSAGVG